MADIDPALWLSYYNTFSNTLTLQERSFACLSDAREALLDILVEQASPGLKGKSARDIMAHSVKVTRWGELFDALLLKQANSVTLPTNTEIRTIALLQLHRKYSEINVAKYIHGQGDPCFWDGFTTEFSEMVDYAATAAGLDQNYAKRTWDTDYPPKSILSYRPWLHFCVDICHCPMPRPICSEKGSCRNAGRQSSRGGIQCISICAGSCESDGS
jgi:hypothetical protein